MSPGSAAPLRSRSTARRVCALLGLLWVVSSVVACGKNIGDPCHTALDCNISATRLCDRTQPGGYCTIASCETGTCPTDSVCVKFRPDVNRLSTTYCMYQCDDADDCRTDQGYRCISAADFGAHGEAKVLDHPSRFCAIHNPPAVLPMTPVDDAGTGNISLPPDDAGLISGG